MHSVNYSNIRDVAIHQSWIESIFHRGTLALYSANREEYGIYIHDIKNVEDAYYEVKQIIENATDY